ncbi:unnamed protein product, partial [Chrysoparadoxa australica]
GYWKVWCKRKQFEAVRVDEAQDLNPVFIRLLESVKDAVTAVFMGDSAQRLYRCNHCVSVKDHWPSFTAEWKLFLTFRFGPEVCDLVNSRRLGAAPTHPGCPKLQTDIVTMAESE